MTRDPAEEWLGFPDGDTCYHLRKVTMESPLLSERYGLEVEGMRIA